MTAIVSPERAKGTWLTGAAGLLLLAAAFIMMACASPRPAPHPHPASPVATSSAPAGQLLSQLRTIPPTPPSPLKTPGEGIDGARAAPMDHRCR